MMYPIVTYMYISVNFYKVYDKDTFEVFHARHDASFKNFNLSGKNPKPRWRVFMALNFRRILYVYMLVFVDKQVSILVGSLVMISLLMMILICSMMPFESKKENSIEIRNEIIIILVLYHMIVLSDFVPMDQFHTRQFIMLCQIPQCHYRCDNYPKGKSSWHHCQGLIKQQLENNL